MTIEQAVGQVVRAKRKALNWTLAKLAAKSGTSLGYLSQIETGWYRPTLKKLKIVSEALFSTLTEVIREAEALIPVVVDTTAVERELEV